MFSEKEMFWSNDLAALKAKFASKMKFKNSYASPAKNSKNEQYDKILAESKNEFKNSVSSHYMQSQDNEENEVNYTNFKRNDDYITLNHPDSVSSKHSMPRQNLGRTVFDNYAKQSNVGNDSILERM